MTSALTVLRDCTTRAPGNAAWIRSASESVWQKSSGGGEAARRRIAAKGTLRGREVVRRRQHPSCAAVFGEGGVS